MRDLLSLLAHLLTTFATLLGPGGVKTVVAQKLLLKQQLLMIKRPRRRAPNLCAAQRLLLGFWSLFLNPRRLLRSAVRRSAEFLDLVKANREIIARNVTGNLLNRHFTPIFLGS